jgi:simple sugar transport system substrate-binding protein
VKDAFNAMVEGKLNCSVECNPLLGPAAFDAIDALRLKNPVPKRTIVKDEVYDQSNAKDALPNRKY